VQPYRKQRPNSGKAERGSLAFAIYLIQRGHSDEEVAAINGGGWTANGSALTRKAMEDVIAEQEQKITFCDLRSK